MTTTDATDVDSPDRFVPLAAAIGERIAPFSAGHDRDGTFVGEAYDILKAENYFALPVPAELGGMGASIHQTAMAQRELARHCAATALASTMHMHITLFAAWRYRREMPGAEALLRRIANDGIVMVSTGGSDFTRPNGTAEKVEGGYRVSGRKIFASQVPAGDIFSTMFTFEDPEQGRVVLGMAVPVGAEGVEVLNDWDTMGMRGTGSHSVQMTDVFVGDAAVQPPRPWGTLDPPLQVIASIAMSVIMAVYLGVAEGARDKAIAQLAGTTKAEDQTVQRLVGLMDYRLRVARWAMLGAMDVVGNDPSPSLENVAAIMQAKRAVAEEAVAATDLAIEAVGGAAFFRKHGIEQAMRDVRGVKFHPLTPEATLLFAGKVALGQPAEEM